jgi:hypothetical protein
MVSFPSLFTGSDQSHGHWSTETGASTDRGPVPESDYLDHLEGRCGLGLVPVRLDGTCIFGALDIDVDTIDHRALWVKVKHRQLPLTVCRSKSGGAHLYVFFSTPTPAATVMKLLRSWSGLLGYPKCEVFPKQPKIDQKNLGNWINLPYFAGDNTTRYAVDQNGPLTLDQFLQQVEFYDPRKPINQELPQLEEAQIASMPPCLEALTRNGLPEGARNNGLLNFGVYFRKAFPNDWEERVRAHNKDHVRPPLDQREVESVIKSLGKSKYAYICHQEPISSRCDRQECLKREYGINHRASMERGFYDDVILGNLRKFLTSPPRYRLEVNGHDIELASEELRTYQTGFKPIIFERLNLLLRPMKQDLWDKQLRELLTTLKEIEVPDDASWQGVVLWKVAEFVNLADRSRAREDILKGLPFRAAHTNGSGKPESFVWFRVSDLQRFLQAAKVQVETHKLFPLLEAEGGKFEETTIKGRTVTLWGIPDSPGTRQTEPFTPPAESAEAKEEM